MSDRPVVDFEYSPRQVLAFQTLNNPSITELMYGGAKGGGKSVFTCYWVFTTAIDFIKKYNIKPCSNPIPIGWMGRLRAVDFEQTTLETWFRFIPEQFYTINRQRREIIICGRVKVKYGGLDDQASVNKFNSAEFAFVTIDQAEEVPLDKIDVLLASRRLKINGHQTQPKALFTANPGQCWLKDQFILNPRPDQKFVRALPTDNCFLDVDQYKTTLSNAFRHRPELLKAYLEGSWDAFEGDDQIILNKYLDNALSVDNQRTNKKYLVCDVARFGNDDTCIMLFEDTAIIGLWTKNKQDINTTSNMLHRLALGNQCSTIIVDDDGIGGGVTDNLVSMSNSQYLVYPYKGQAKAANPENYYNRRAEAWDTAAKMLQNGEISLFRTGQLLNNHQMMQLKGQLMSAKYDFRGARMLCEAKDKIKKRIGRSPDWADTAIMGWYYYQFVPDRRIKRKDFNGKRSQSRYGKRSAMAA